MLDGPAEAFVILPDGTVRPVPLTGLSIGRRVDADLVIDDASVSRRHARIVWRGDACYITDLGSRNGTTLNGVPVVGEMRLSDDDELHLGDAVLQFRQTGAARVEQPPAPAPAPAVPRGDLPRRAPTPLDDDTRATAPLPRGGQTRLTIDVSEPVQDSAGLAVHVELRGVLDIETAEQLRSQTSRLFDMGVAHYLLDLENLEYLDSSGLAALVALRRQVESRKGSVRLRHAQPAVRGIIELTRLDRIFTLE